MVLRLFLPMFFVFIFSGCATTPENQSPQPQGIAYQKPGEDFLQDEPVQDFSRDYLTGDSYKKPVAKSYSGAARKLSPKQIQRALKNAGFYRGAIDGKIGPKTKKAVVEFQKANNLKPDGIVGKRTAERLNGYLSR